MSVLGIPSTLAAAPGFDLRNDGEYLIENWTTEDGLPGNAVTGIAQTPDGYLWIGTFAGLARFDGVRFQIFHPDLTPQFSLDSIVVTGTDQQGRLWTCSPKEELLCLTTNGFKNPLDWGLPPGPLEFCGESPEGH